MSDCWEDFDLDYRELEEDIDELDYWDDWEYLYEDLEEYEELDFNE